MALSIILRRSASRVIGSGNRFYGNLIVPSANSVPWLRQFCSSPSLQSCHDNESLVKEAKRASFDESLVNDLMSQVQALQKDLESLRKSYGKENESLVEGESMDDQSESEDSSLKHVVNESSNDEGEGEDLESVKSSDDSSDEGKYYSECDSDDDDSKQKSSSESDNSDHESLSERDDKPDDDKSLPTKNENEQLIKGIEEEIMLAKKFRELSAPDTIIPADFPFNIGRYEDNSIYLTREYEGESVHVHVENPTIFLLKDYGHGYNKKKSSSFSMDLTVFVSCMTSNLTKVELKCGARSEGISIYGMKGPEDGSDGVHMSEFSENLKGEFLKYLEARGITEKTTKFLYGYMLDKVNKDKLMILENIHKMLV